MSFLEFFLDNADDIWIEIALLLWIASHPLTLWLVWIGYWSSIPIKLKVKASICCTSCWSVTLIQFSKIFLICQGVWSKLLSLFPWSLLLLQVWISHLETFLSCWLVHARSLQARIIWLHIVPLLSHMKYWWSFARVIDNIVVDIIIVYDVGDIATTRGNSPPLNSLLLWVNPRYSTWSLSWVPRPASNSPSVLTI